MLLLVLSETGLFEEAANFTSLKNSSRLCSSQLWLLNIFLVFIVITPLFSFLFYSVYWHLLKPVFAVLIWEALGISTQMLIKINQLVCQLDFFFWFINIILSDDKRSILCKHLFIHQGEVMSQSYIAFFCNQTCT